MAAGQRDAVVKVTYKFEVDPQGLKDLKDAAAAQAAIQNGGTFKTNLNTSGGSGLPQLKAGSPFTPGGGGGPPSGGSFSSRSDTNVLLHGLGRINSSIQATNSILRSIHIQNSRGRPGGGVGVGGNGDSRDKSPLGDASSRQLLRMALAYVVYEVVSDIPRATTAALNASQRGDLNQSQRTQATAQEVPVVGRIVRLGFELANAIEGTTERIRAANANLTYMNAANQGAARQQSAFGTLDFQASQAKNEARALGRLSPRMVDRGDRTTFGGEIGYQENERRRRIATQLDVAGANVSANRANVSAAEQQVGQSRGYLASLKAERDRLRDLVNEPSQFGGAGGDQDAPNTAFADFFQDTLNSIVNPGGMTGWQMPLGGQMANVAVGAGNAMLGPMFGEQQPLGQPNPANQMQNPADHLQNLTQLAAINGQIAAAETEQEARLRRLQAAREALGQSEAAQRQASINGLKEEIAMMKEREQRMSAGAQRLGMMNPIQRLQGMNALRMVQQAGAEGFMNLPDAVRQQAAGIAPGIVGRIAEQAGQRTEAFGMLRDGGEFGPGREQNLDQLRESIDRMADQLSTQELRNLQDTANTTLSAISSTLMEIKQAILNQTQVTLDNVGVNAQILAANQLNG